MTVPAPVYLTPGIKARGVRPPVYDLAAMDEMKQPQPRNLIKPCRGDGSLAHASTARHDTYGALGRVQRRGALLGGVTGDDHQGVAAGHMRGGRQQLFLSRSCEELHECSGPVESGVPAATCDAPDQYRDITGKPPSRSSSEGR